jgi:NADPH:quinone reductase-like Zn-dependent oxidoreductase
MTTIRKAVVTAYGGPETVKIITEKLPDPSSHEVQIKVLYAGMGGSDMAMRNGVYPRQKAAPLTLGYCCVGRVHKNGRSSKKFQVGDLVACLTVYDAQAELTNQPEKYVVPLPEGIDLQQAVALVLDWNVGYALAYHAASISPGQRVFVHGLSGSCGFACATFCKMQGAEVYGTASEANHQAVREAGFTPFVYTDKKWIESMKELGKAHFVFDPLGFESYDDSWQILAGKKGGPRGGHLIGYGGNYNALKGGKPRSQTAEIAKLLARGLVPFCPYKTSFYYIDRDQKEFEPDLKILLGLLQRGAIRVPIRQVWTLDQVPEGHRVWNKGPGIGAVIVAIADDSGR